MQEIMTLSEARTWARTVVIEELQKRCISQKQLAKEINWSQSYISNIINHPERVCAPIIWELCSFLGHKPIRIIIAPEDLCWYQTPMNKKNIPNKRRNQNDQN